MLRRLLAASLGLYLFIGFGIGLIDRISRGDTAGQALGQTGRAWAEAVTGPALPAHAGLILLLVLFAFLGAWVARRTRPRWGWASYAAAVALLAGLSYVAFVVLAEEPPDYRTCCARPPEPGEKP